MLLDLCTPSYKVRLSITSHSVTKSRNLDRFSLIENRLGLIRLGFSPTDVWVFWIWARQLDTSLSVAGTPHRTPGHERGKKVSCRTRYNRIKQTAQCIYALHKCISQIDFFLLLSCMLTIGICYIFHAMISKVTFFVNKNYHYHSLHSKAYLNTVLSYE